MCLQHVAGGDDPFLEAQGGVAQVFVGFLQVLFGHGQLLGGFVDLECRLVDLQLYLLLGVIQLVLRDACRRLGCPHLVDAFAPVPDGQRDGDPHVPHALELVLEAVEHRRAGGRVAAYQGNGGQVVGTHHVHLLAVHLRGQFQAAHFGAQGIHAVHVDVARGYGVAVCQGFFLLVGQRDGGGEVYAAQLAQQHARQGHPVGHLGQCHFRLVHLHFHRQAVRLGGHAFGYHFVHVAFYLLQQFQVALGKFLLVDERHHLPVGLVGAQDDFLHAAVVLLAGQLFGIAGDFVVSAYLSAHVEGLGQGQCAGIHVACVRAESVYQ